MLTEKYKPKTFAGIIGNKESKEKIINFIRNFKSQYKKSILLYGPAGSGKTALVYALASEQQLEIIELNASDFRNKQNIHEVIGGASQQKSLFARGKLILVDELEGISGTADRGGLQELIRLIKETQWPIILIANDTTHERLRPLKKEALQIEIKALDKLEIAALLQKICASERINIKPDAIEALATISKGDARSAIVDLQILALDNKEITKTDVLKLDSREKDGSIHNALKMIFKLKGTQNAFDGVNLDMDDIFLWLDENLPLEYKGNELAKAYEILSKADVLRGRIRRQQHWRFLAYIMPLLSEGISNAKKESRQNFASYKQPSRILKIWMANQRNTKKKAIAVKLAKATHSSKKSAVQNMPYFDMAFKNSREIQQLAAELRLLPEERDYFNRN